jgi:hypothetical protein
MTPGREAINSEASADIRFGALVDSSRTSRDVRKSSATSGCHCLNDHRWMRRSEATILAGENTLFGKRHYVTDDGSSVSIADMPRQKKKRVLAFSIPKGKCLVDHKKSV